MSAYLGPPVYLYGGNIFSHDPEAEGAIVMKAPSKAHGIKYNSQYVEDSI